MMVCRRQRRVRRCRNWQRKDRICHRITLRSLGRFSLMYIFDVYHGPEKQRSRFLATIRNDTSLSGFAYCSESDVLFAPAINQIARRAGPVGEAELEPRIRQTLRY